MIIFVCQHYDCIKCYKSNVFLLVHYMNNIPTPEQICEFDTFTLEETVEELERHPQKGMFGQLIKIAKLELIDRLEIQEFGRKLANDQYEIDIEIKLPVAQPKASSYKNISSLQNRKQFIAKMQMNLLTAGSYVTVGKPPINHHYKPKPRKLEAVEKNVKHFLKAKKSQVSKPKTSKGVVGEVNSHRQKILTAKPTIKIELNNQKIPQVKHCPLSEQTVVKTPQFSLKQKLKRQVKEMDVSYRQNDAYDDMKQITLSPQNLIEEEIKILSDEQSQIKTEIEEQYSTLKNNTSTHVDFEDRICKNSQLFSSKVERQEDSQQKQQIKEIVCMEKEQNKSNVYEHLEQEQSKFLQIHQKNNSEIKEDKNNSYPLNHDIINDSVVQAKQSHMQNSNLNQRITIDFDKLNKKINFKEASLNKQTKSKSVRSFNKKTIQNLRSNIEHCEILTNKVNPKINQLFNQKIYLAKQYKQDGRQKYNQISKMSSSNYGQFRGPKLDPNIYHYHQIIPSFAKLFPHSKNLLVTLRNVQQGLKSHINKQISQKSRSNKYLRLNEHQITFRIISQSDKAQKHKNLFNISLQSFYERGKIMLNRIRREGQDLSNQEMLLYRVIRTKQQVYDIVNSSFHRTQNWFELPHGLELKNSWNLLWTWSKPQIQFNDLLYFQKVNHFIGNKQIARKDLLKKNIQKIQKLGPKMKQYFDFIPETFLLPGENINFIKKFRQYGLKDPLNYWILKPVGLSRGRGISLVNKLQQVIFSQPVVLQKYVANPLLIDDYKFDMRIYVLVTSINPLQAFIYKQGFARLSTQKYSLNEDQMQNKFIHLTNFSIQKQNISQPKSQSIQEQVGGCKISLKMLSQKLQQMGISWSIIYKQIEEIVIKSLVSCMNVIPSNPNCFQLFGYDIFVDSDLKCWLLQVNSSPSLQKQYTLDKIIKQQLVDDIIQIVNPLNYDRERLLQIVQRRRKEAEGLKSSINTSNNSVHQLNEDLHYILRGKTIRKYGQLCQQTNFKVIAPSDMYYQTVKAVQQYKIDPIIKSII